MNNYPDNNIFTTLNEKIVNDILSYLHAQGHFFEGDLQRSIILMAEDQARDYLFGIDALDYMLDLEFGVSAEDMQRKDIDTAKLARWVKFRRSQGHATPGVNRIIKYWHQNGFELPGAIVYSQKPNINLAITSTFNYYEQDYYNNIDEIVFKSFDDEFFTIKSETIK